MTLSKEIRISGNVLKLFKIGGRDDFFSQKKGDRINVFFNLSEIFDYI